MNPLKTFYRPVDKRSKKDMIEFLSSHFRYNTMNSWNRSTSYANNVKVYSVIPNELTSKVFELMDVGDDFYEPINDIVRDWGEANEWEYQAGFNGRSGGYIVMYEGQRKLSGHKSVCTACWQRNFKTVEETGNNKCGRCGANSRINRDDLYVISTWPGRSIDMETDFEDWEMYSLKRRVELVQSFDKMCDVIVLATINMALDCSVEEEIVMIPKTIKHIV